MRSWLLASLLLTSTALPLAQATAGVPDPAQSTVPCLIACDFPFVVTVRDAGGNPVANVTVSVEFCLDRPNSTVQSPPPFVFCCTGNSCAGPGSSTFLLSGPDGKATFFIAGGGELQGTNLVSVRADGLTLANLIVTSVDLNGDFTVDANDVAFANGLLGSADPAADFDCSGVVDANDLSLQAAHLGHVCHCAVPNRSTTWGRVKIVYR